MFTAVKEPRILLQQEKKGTDLFSLSGIASFRCCVRLLYMTYDKLRSQLSTIIVNRQPVDKMHVISRLIDCIHVRIE